MYFLVNLTMAYTANKASIANHNNIKTPKATPPVLAILIRGNAIPITTLLANTIPTTIVSM